MFKILILVCAAGLPHRDCTPKTADSMVRGPSHASLLECAFNGQSQIAATAIAPDPGKQYLKIMCRPADLAQAGTP